MTRIFRIVFCVLACLFVAAVIPVGAILGLRWGIACAAAACVFGVLTVLLRNAQAKKVLPTVPDFMNSPEENEKIRSERENDR